MAEIPNPKTPTRNVSARWWRQVGFWGLTINASLGFPAMLLMLIFVDEVELGVVSGMYAAILAAWTAAAGIRQWGKNQAADKVSYEMEAVDTGPLE